MAFWLPRKNLVTNTASGPENIQEKHETYGHNVGITFTGTLLVVDLDSGLGNEYDYHKSNSPECGSGAGYE